MFFVVAFLILLFIFSSFSEVKLINENYVYLKCTICCFDIHVHCEMTMEPFMNLRVILAQGPC